MTELDVYHGGELAGNLSEHRGALRFVYTEAWIEAGRPPLSQSLPIERPATAHAAHAFFDGLLPEGRPRELVARRLHVSPANVIGLLAELGWDCAGAITTYPSGAEPLTDGDGSDVRWLDERELARLIDDLPSRPMLVDDDGEIRVSLAGVQDKLPVVVAHDNRIGLASGKRGVSRRTPSTHILKAPIERLPNSVANEAFCLALARAIGLPAALAEPRRALDREFLLVERYDREQLADGRVKRIHQEDFCQALGVKAARKYEAEGGPGLADLFRVIRETATAPAAGVLALLDAVGFNLLIANDDAHAKNFSLLYEAGGGVSLAPFYDLVSTFIYRSIDARLSGKLAMKIGDEYRADRIHSRHFDRLFRECDLNPVAARRRLVELAERTPKAAALVATGWDDDLTAKIVDLVDERATRLIGELA